MAGERLEAAQTAQAVRRKTTCGDRYLRKAGGSVLMDTALYFSSLPWKISSHSEAFSRVTLVAADSQEVSVALALAQPQTPPERLSGKPKKLHQNQRV